MTSVGALLLSEASLRASPNFEHCSGSPEGAGALVAQGPHRSRPRRTQTQAIPPNYSEAFFFDFFFGAASPGWRGATAVNTSGFFGLLILGAVAGLGSGAAAGAGGM